MRLMDLFRKRGRAPARGAGYRHERFAGKGYPTGLKGEITEASAGETAPEKASVTA